MWTDIAHTSIGKALVSKIHPKYAFDFYLAEFLTLKELIDIVEPQLHVNAVVKLHCAQGKSIKQAKGKNKSLLDVLTSASPQDLLVDLLEICKAVSSSYATNTGYDSYMKVRKRSGYEIKSKDTSFMPNGNYLTYHLKSFNRAGTFSSLFESIKRCDQEFAASGARTRFKIRFTSNHICVDGVEIRLPDMMVWTGKEVALNLWGLWAFVDRYGRATYYGKETEDALKPFMECWNNDALNACEIIGKACSSCILCGRELTDPNSVSTHVGPVCRKRYGTALKFKSYGPITGTTLTIPPSETRPIVLPSGLTFNVPQRVVDQSAFLQGLFDLDDPSSIDATKFLGVSPEALTLLDEILGDAQWVPESITSLEMALPVADKLGLDELTKRLEGMYVDIFHSFEHWTEWEEVQRRVTAKKETMKNSGPLTQPKVNKRKRGVEAHCDLIQAIAANDVAKMNEIFGEVGRDCCKDNSTKSDKRNFPRLMSDALGKCTTETLEVALRMGVKHTDCIFDSWQRPGHLELYVKYTLVNQYGAIKLMNHILEKGTLEDVTRVYPLLQGPLSTPTPLSKEDELKKRWLGFDTPKLDWKKALWNSSSAPYLWVLQQGLLPTTEKHLEKALARCSHDWFITDCLPLFKSPPTVKHLEAAHSTLLHTMLTMPEYMGLVDSDFLMYCIEHKSHNILPRMVELFPGPLEVRHCPCNLASMKIIHAKFPLFPACVEKIGMVMYLQVVGADVDMEAMVNSLKCPEEHMARLILHFRYQKDEVVFQSAKKMAAVMNKEWATKKLPDNGFDRLYSKYTFENYKCYKEVLCTLHTDPTVFF